MKDKSNNRGSVQSAYAPRKSATANYTDISRSRCPSSNPYDASGKTQNIQRSKSR